MDNKYMSATMRCHDQTELTLEWLRGDGCAGLTLRSNEGLTFRLAVSDSDLSALRRFFLLAQDKSDE